MKAGFLFTSLQNFLTVAFIISFSIPAQTAISDQDKVVFLRIHQLNQLQMALAKEVMAAGTNQRVRALAERVFRDHRFADRQLSRLALEKGFSIELFNGETPSKVETLSLQKLKADAKVIDEALARRVTMMYPRVVEESHVQAHMMLEGAYSEIQQEELREMVLRQLPIIAQQARIAGRVSGQLVSD